MNKVVFPLLINKFIHSRAVALFGKGVSGILAQVLVSTKEDNICVDLITSTLTSQEISAKDESRVSVNRATSGECNHIKIMNRIRLICGYPLRNLTATEAF